ncbi:hypothetical protein M0802_014441 [Mischocyttarus mexicanus]|nr:hypothetical protein M0802_014441 [Mischocyttarus mexicanus]
MPLCITDTPQNFNDKIAMNYVGHLTHKERKTKEFLIEKLGLLTLEPGCLATKSDTALKSDQTIETLPARHYESPFSYKFNSSTFREPALKLDLIQTPKLSQIHANRPVLRNAA